MTESIRYLSLALQTIKLLQTQLIKHLQKISPVTILEFKRSFDNHLNKVKNIELQKSIESDKISTCLNQLNDFLQKIIRGRKTSQSQRYNYRTNLFTRQTDRMGLTGASFYTIRRDNIAEVGLSQIEQITKSYKINNSPKFNTKMKWRLSSNQGSKQVSRQLSKQQKKNETIGNSNIQMLNQTIPQMQNRIKMLSLNRPNPDQIKQPYRTLQSRSHQLRRYIPRLF